MSEQLRIGLVGTSGYSENAYLKGLAGHQDAAIVAICARNRARAEALASTYQIGEVFTDYAEMIKQAKLDALIVATPDVLHHPITMTALDAGLHVLCEKPMATSVKEAGEMLNAAERAGVKHMIEFTWLWAPHYQYLHHLVSEGYIGRGYHHHFRFLGNRGRVKDYTWRFDPRHSIGVLGDLGSHMADLALWIGGDVTSVSANLASFSERVDPEGQTIKGANESALLSIDFADGAQGMLHVSTVAHTAARGREQYVSLHGEEGTLDVEWIIFGAADQGVVIRGARQDDQDFRILEVPEDYLRGAKNGDIFSAFYTHMVGPKLFVDAILNDYMPEPSFRQGFKVQQVLDAAIESNATGRRIDLKS